MNICCCAVYMNLSFLRLTEHTLMFKPDVVQNLFITVSDAALQTE